MKAVDVWRCSLDVDDAAFAWYERSVAEDEREHAVAMRDPLARRRWVVARAVLRTVLASCLSERPESLVLVRGPQGKPRLAEERGLRFSVSHTDGLAMVAVAWGREVGIDVERIVPARALGPIADVLFSRAEAWELAQLDGGDRVRRFFEIWTRKEAYAKACGAGITPVLALELRRLGRGWTFRELPAGPEHVAAVCVAGPGARVRTREFAP
jgi:4'-phosphopantetheinyl transferase